MTTGDTSLDAFVLFAVMALLLLPLVILAWPMENTATGRDWAQRVGDRLFGRGGWWDR